ncbi:MAG: hypothetical protein IJ896_05060 [Fibrobacter sp.]|nr:hypothetical protein [Fibrobacter sp.]
MKSKKATRILQTLAGQESICWNVADLLDALVDVWNIEYMSDEDEGTPVYNRLLESSARLLVPCMMQTAGQLSNIHLELSAFLKILEDPNISKPLPLANALHAWEEKPLSGSGWERES